ncbi:hypothetical protein AAGQ96_12350 [Pantoea sp. MBD-2R]|uniref:hypothetical protein n=1 Tax=unclassified Pantoea TaxID=2630326 RepID=UPI0011BF9C06|nr:hypothetical protein [Pantoea sp. CCBC3-3-1]
MDNHDTDKLRDIMLGEATLALLEQQRPLNNTALLRQLRVLAAREPDDARRKACLAAIREVRNTQVSAHDGFTRRPADDDSVFH